MRRLLPAFILIWLGLNLQVVEAAPKGQKNGKTPSAKQQSQAVPIAGLSTIKNSNEPTYINSDSLSLNSQNRVFTYIGNVQVTQGDMVLRADVLDGKYSTDNKIQELVARKNVYITKGKDIKARSERAVYDAQKELLTLTENPELAQGESVLSADVVKVFLRENKSLAEGQVKMKLVQGSDAPFGESTKR